MSDATIYDVSQLAKVSTATVSRVLNSPDRVSAKTRTRVIKAIDELNFVPKSEAVARARKNFGRIGILTATSTVDSFVDRLRGLFDVLSEHNYEPIIYDVTSNAQRDSYLASLPSGRSVDGLIIIDLPLDEASEQRILKYKLPTVQIVASAKSALNSQLTTIIHNDGEGGDIAANYLLEKGYKNIGYIGDMGQLGTLDAYYDEKLDRFRQALARQGVALPDKFVYAGSHSLAHSPSNGMEPARKMMHNLLDLPDRPDAVFSGNDTLALGVLRAIRERGLRVPEDVAVIGFDNISVAEYVGLTTIDQQLKKSGRLAVELLLKQMKGEHATAETTELQFKLIQRETA